MSQFSQEDSCITANFGQNAGQKYF